MNTSLNSRPSELAIEPIRHPLDACVRMPGSKSLTNRALMVAALARGTTRLVNALFSDDSHYFSEALKTLGFAIESDPEGLSYTVVGQGGRIPAHRADLFVGNAGTAARFLTAMLSLGEGEYLVDGEPRMRERPIADLIGGLNQLGGQVSSPTGCLPVQVRGSGLLGGFCSVAGNVSSQFLSGLLMVAPYARTSVEVVVENGLNSKPYVDMTISVMSDFGVDATRQGYHSFVVRPGTYRACDDYPIEPDASAASYFFAAPVILGGRVRVQRLSRSSKQGDIAFLDILEQMGCTVTQTDEYLEVSSGGPLQGVNVDMRNISDTAQTLAVIAPFAASPTTIRGIGFIRAKETDRIGAVCTELRRLGVDVEEQPDGLVIQPCTAFQPGCVQTYNDHRMAMAFSLLGLRIPGVSIENPGCVSKTFPDYFTVLEALR
ncbi:MAG TPA: 3-phosphoshikimate 1-carboxyvinyltransferase [Anaerolineales bacterium]|nr:3-phosphoshikimate 1-carboxyvinyltransferase [Anaerolineales bacterium]